MKKFIAALLILLGGAATWVVVGFVRASRPGGDGLLARLEDSDGATYLVTQRWNNWVEPYTISFYRREPDGRWGWCYIDHQSDRWSSAELRRDVDGQCVRVLREGCLVAVYSKERSTFSLFDADGRCVRTLPSPQCWSSERDFQAIPVGPVVRGF